MGLLDLFSRPRASIQQLPSGSMTLDRNANILASTIPSTISDEMLREIGLRVIALFKTAAAAQMPISELKMHFANLQITARELRGGAVVFLSPKQPFAVTPEIS